MNYVSQAEVIEVIKYKEDINEYLIKLDKKRKYLPGTFVQLTLDIVSASDIWPESRTFSIASYQKDIMRFIIKNVGLYTNRIFNELKVGDRCTIKYPFGDLFDKNTINEKHVFIAGGVGVTPFIGLIEYFEDIHKLEEVHLFYSAKYVNDLLHINELEENLGNNLSVFITKGESIKYINRRMNISDFQCLTQGTNGTNYYICGSKSFRESIKNQLINQGYTKIYMDEWE